MSNTAAEDNAPFGWTASLAKDADWERPLDACELFYRRMTPKGAGCYPVTASASIAFPSGSENVESRFQRAWALLRREYPSLGSRVALGPDGTWMRKYTELDAAGKMDWLSSTFKVVDDAEGPAHWLDSSTAIATLLLVKPREGDVKHTVFLQCPHDLTDGVGVLYLLHRLFFHYQILSRLAEARRSGGIDAVALDIPADEDISAFVRDLPDDEMVALSPSLQAAANIPAEPSALLKERFKEIAANNGGAYRHPGLLSLPPSPKTSAQGLMHRASVSVPLATSGQIIAACKTSGQGLSVTHVFLAGLAQALASLQPARDGPYDVRYANQFMMNLRPYLPAPYNTVSYAAAAYHTVSSQAMVLDLVAGQRDATATVEEFRRCAGDARDFFQSFRPTFPGHEEVQLAPLVFNSLAEQAGPDPHAVSDTPFCPVALSSLGVLDKFVSRSYGDLVVDHVWAASEPIGAGVALFLSTWGGKVELSAVFRTNYHDVAYVEGFLGRVVDSVCAGLGVE